MILGFSLVSEKMVKDKGHEGQGHKGPAQGKKCNISIFNFIGSRPQGPDRRPGAFFIYIVAYQGDGVCKEPPHLQPVVRINEKPYLLKGDYGKEDKSHAGVGLGRLDIKISSKKFPSGRAEWGIDHCIAMAMIYFLTYEPLL